jgi:hypothetical protein
MQQDGSAGIHRTENYLRGGVRSVVSHAHHSHSECNGEMLFWTIVLSWTGGTALPSHSTFFRTPR